MDVLTAVLCVVVIFALISAQRNRLGKMAIIEGQLLSFQNELQNAVVEHVGDPKSPVKPFISDLKIID